MDFRLLNSVSEMDLYPMPRVEDLVERVGSGEESYAAAYLDVVVYSHTTWEEQMLLIYGIKSIGVTI